MSTQARSRRGSLKARRNLKQDKQAQKACKAKEIVRSTAKVPTSRNPHLFLLTARRQIINLFFETRCNLCMQL